MKDSFVADLRPGSLIHTTFLVQSKERKKGRSEEPGLAPAQGDLPL